ncbi:unnamed protein product [Rotaria magnacalcarata]
MDLNQLEPSFMYSHLLKEIILDMNYTVAAKYEFAEYRRVMHHDNPCTLNMIEWLGKEYLLHSPVWCIFRIGEIALLDNGVWNVKLILTHHDDADLRRLMTVISRDVEGSTGLYRLGLLMAKMGEWDKAKDVYELLAEKTSDDENSMPASLHHQLGVIYYQKADLQNALIHYQKIAQQQFEISLIGCPSSCTKLHKHWYYILQAG